MGIADIISLLGGLSFFLFGMTLLGDGLKRVAGSKLETILGKLTSNPIKGVLLGALVTAVIQSSSATTVMVVGFVNSGLMQLSNAVGIVMGANIGTTATGWVLTLANVEGGGGFTSATVFAFIAFVGIILYFFCRRQGQKNVGLILLAFSVLMSGMQTMSSAMDPLKSNEAFLNFISAASNPAVSLITGLLVTAVIQSSSASIGILQALSATGAISYEVAIPMVLGMCIGACVPVLLSAIGANANGKRTAVIYLYFNIVGSVLFMVPFYLLHLVLPMEFMAGPADAFGIAVFNTVFKVAATLVQLPVTGLLMKLACATIKEERGEDDERFQENLLDERFLDYPPLALEQSGRTVERMAAAAFKNLNRSIDLFTAFSGEKYDKIMGRESVVDRYEDRLGSYLFHLNSRDLNERETLVSSHYLHCLTDLERISDHAVNLADLAREMDSKGIAFSKDGLEDMTRATDAVREILCLAQQALEREDMAVAQRVEPLEEVISSMMEGMKLRHIRRLQNGACTLELGFILNDCINNFERVAAHCSNVALAVLELRYADLQFHDYARDVRQGDQPEFRKWLAFYKDKYLDAAPAS
ncbi:MAG: Na/Pi cotransporter family protein [Oscillospiraceae bacterium]|nr:Na/Pi cotransporter family protein [Oscillospiraceae bacterium]MCI9547968.1 Na/Pi cotransporter family protein [Oscillospiraceae bacterium]